MKLKTHLTMKCLVGIMNIKIGDKHIENKKVWADGSIHQEEFIHKQEQSPITSPQIWVVKIGT